MNEYDHYVTYTNEMSRLRDRVERTQRTRLPGRSRRHGRAALARGLHSLADRLDG